MAENTAIVKIQQFDGTNFSNWKFRVGILLDERGLRKYIEEKLDDILKTVKDDDAEKEKQLSKLKLEEKKCMSILMQTISDGQLEYIKDKKTAKEMFDTLCGIFERKSIAGQLLVRKQLLMMKYHESEDITQHFLNFDTKIRKLKSTGAKMEELDIIVHLLLTLPKSFENLVTALETMNQDDLKLDFVKTRLMDEHNKRTGMTSSNKPNESSAMNVNHKKKKLTCYGCGKIGHIKSKCRAQNSQKKDSSENANKAGDGKAATMCAVVSEHEKSCKAQPTVHAHTTQRNDDSAHIKFVFDSGATQHMVNDKRYFDHLENVDEIEISVAKKNQCISANQQGEITVKTFHDGDSSSKTMQNVLLVKDLSSNLMSIRSLTKKGYRIVFEGDCAYASINGKTQFVANANGRLYEVVMHIDRSVFAGISGENNINKISQHLWHFRMAHLNARDMAKIVNRKMAIGLEKVNVNTESEFCESCVYGKQTRTPFPPNKIGRSKRVLELIHSDVWGPFKHEAHDGSKYFVSFTDDFSRASMVYCIQSRTEVLDKFKEFVAMAEALHGKKVAKFRADNAGEYSSHEMNAFCKSKGIQRVYSIAYNPEMNSVSERLNRTLEEKATTMLLASGLDKKFWSEAIQTANYIKNRSPTSAFGVQFKDMTPAEIWFNQKPDLSHLRIFGSECYNHIPANNRSKLEAKATKCLMLGYTHSIGSYRLWDTERNKVVLGRHVTFNEASVLKRAELIELSDSEAATNQIDDTMSSVSDGESTLCGDELDSFNSCFEESDHEANDIHNTNLESVGNRKTSGHGANGMGTGDDKDNVNSVIENDIGNNNGITLRRSNRERHPPNRYGEWNTEGAHFALSAEQFVDNDPNSIDEAKARDDWHEWKRAINSEHESLVKNGTWTVCDLPKGRKAITNKWVFKLKRKANGEIDKYKARVVARGFTQKFGFDYTETYAPVAKLVTLKILLAIANRYDMHIHQMDVKCAFLNGELTEEIYMELPEGFKDGNKVCKLNKALYGLKQASRAWNEKFNEFMIQIGFKRCESDRCLYVKVQNGVICYILLYVDDTLIFCTDIKVINTAKQMLAKKFEMTDVGEVNSFLGMHIEQDIKNGTITMNQSQYLENVLQKFDMKDCKARTTPMEKTLHIEKGDKENCSDLPYRELIGCLTYATVTTRPDLCSATGYFSRFQSCFDDRHFNHAKHILRYIRGTVDIKMVYTKQEDAETLVGFSDSDWGGDKNDGKSTSGYVFKLFGNTVSWASRKQTTVSLSSTEAEYIALTEAICELKWIRKLLAELKIQCNEPVVIFEDNQSCISIATETKESKRMKHLDIKYNFIRDVIARGEVCIKYKPTDEQVADIMTKGLGKNLFAKHRKELNLI